MKPVLEDLIELEVEDIVYDIEAYLDEEEVVNGLLSNPLIKAVTSKIYKSIFEFLRGGG